MNLQLGLTLIAILIGPAGVWLGWWLNERSTSARAVREAATRERTETTQRVLATLACARALASDVRSLAHGAHLKHTVAEPIGFQEMITQFNSARSNYAEAVLAIRVLGPSWAVAPAEHIEVQGQQWTKLIMEMIRSLNNTQIQVAERELPRLDASVSAFIREASDRFNPEATELPGRPSREATFEAVYDQNPGTDFLGSRPNEGT